MAEKTTWAQPSGTLTEPRPDPYEYVPAPAAKPGFADRLRTPVAGAILGGVVILGVGFGAGYLVGKDSGSASSVVSPAGQTGPGQTGPGQTGPGQTGPGFGQGFGPGQFGGGMGGFGGQPGTGQTQDGTGSSQLPGPGTLPDGTSQDGAATTTTSFIA